MNDHSVTEQQLQDYVYALATSPCFAQTGIVFAARASGLYRSDDGGQSWRDCYNSLNLAEPLLTTTVALSPDFATDQTVFAGAPGGILRSSDGGETWQITMLPAPPPTPSGLVVSPNFTQDGVVLAGTMEDGIFRSTDRGSQWQAWNFGLLDLNIISLAISPGFAQDETLYAGTESGLFRSTNGGRAWREINWSLGFEPALFLALSPHHLEDERLFVGTETKGLFFSSDRGETWAAIGEDKIHGNVGGIVLSPDYPDRPDILVMLNDALYLSRNGGQTWTDITPVSGQGLTAIAAPQGLESGAPLLVGLASGQVVQVTLNKQK